MRWQATESFERDHRRLSGEEKDLFHKAVNDFNAACDAFIESRHPWPAHLRVKSVQGARGIFEMTWSFSGPDGRATWEWAEVEVEEGGRSVKYPAVRWRRLGGHEIFDRP